MEAPNPVPWHNRPARPFPVHRWMMQRYGFILPPIIFVRRPGAPSAPQQGGQRPFPAMLWMEGRARRE